MTSLSKASLFQTFVINSAIVIKKLGHCVTKDVCKTPIFSRLKVKHRDSCFRKLFR